MAMRRRLLPAEPILQRIQLRLALLRIAAMRTVRALLSPSVAAVALFVLGACMCCAGVRILAGDGWALIAGAINAYVLAFALGKALSNG